MDGRLSALGGDADDDPVANDRRMLLLAAPVLCPGALSSKQVRIVVPSGRRVGRRAVPHRRREAQCGWGQPSSSTTVPAPCGNVGAEIAIAPSLTDTRCCAARPHRWAINT